MNCLDKDKLLEWLKVRCSGDWWYQETNEIRYSWDYAHGVQHVMRAVERGEFDVEYGDAV